MTGLAAACMCALQVFLGAFEYREGPAGIFMPAQNGPVYSGSIEPAGKMACGRSGYSYLDFSASRPYGLTDLDSSRITAGYAGEGFGTEVGWDRFGIEEYMENTLTVAAAYTPLKYFSVAAGVHRYALSISIDEFRREQVLWDCGMDLTFRPFRFMSATFCIDNMNTLACGDRSDLVHSQTGGAVSVSPAKGLYWSWYCSRSDYGFINSLAMAANITEWLSLRGGYTNEMSACWASLIVLIKRISFAYGIRYHPCLGYSHSVGFSMTSGAMAFSGMDYRERFFRHRGIKDIRRIDINTCTLDELRDVPVITDKVAERIMLYRESIGPVSRKALFQIGMKDGQIRGLNQYVYGLRDPAEKFKGRGRAAGRRGLDNRTKRELFSRLLACGLSAAQSLRITRLTELGKMQEIILYAGSLPGKGGDREKKIRKICSEYIRH